MLHAYTESKRPKTGNIFTSIEELYTVLSAILLSRIDKESVKAKAQDAKSQKIMTNLTMLVDELHEYNGRKFVAHR